MTDEQVALLAANLFFIRIDEDTLMAGIDVFGLAELNYKWLKEKEDKK